MHILIVEDDDRIVGFMKRGLEAEGHDIDVASGKSNALARASGRPCDMVIIDIFLGPDDGLEICQTLRQQQIRIPILIITAKGTAETEKASEAAGADAYLAKPFAFEDLVTTINRLRPSSTAADFGQEVHPRCTDCS